MPQSICVANLIHPSPMAANPDASRRLSLINLEQLFIPMITFFFFFLLFFSLLFFALYFNPGVCLIQTLTCPDFTDKERSDETFHAMCVVRLFALYLPLPMLHAYLIIAHIISGGQ